MSGIKINLKKKSQGINKPTIANNKLTGFSLKKKQKLIIKSKGLLNNDDSDEESEPTKREIDSFSKDTLTPEEVAVVIKHESKVKRIPNKEEIANAQEAEAKETQLKYGVTTFDQQSGRTPTTSSKTKIRSRNEQRYQGDNTSDEEEDFKSVPIGEFGAAFLRGLGWDGSDDIDKKTKENEKEIVLHRQRGPTLGIGAKALDSELSQDLMGNNFEVPLVKRKK